MSQLLFSTFSMFFFYCGLFLLLTPSWATSCFILKSVPSLVCVVLLDFASVNQSCLVPSAGRLPPPLRVLPPAASFVQFVSESRVSCLSFVRSFCLRVFVTSLRSSAPRVLTPVLSSSRVLSWICTLCLLLNMWSSLSYCLLRPPSCHHSLYTWQYMKLYPRLWWWCLHVNQSSWTYDDDSQPQKVLRNN